MPFRCIAVDDELPALQLIKNYAGRIPGLKMIQLFNDAISAGEYLRNAEIDILFVDINMPDINGIELVKSLVTPPLIIFTTAYKKFAYNGFELEAVDYLLKPIDFDRFKRGAEKALAILEQRTQTIAAVQPPLFVRSEYKLVRIELDKISFIEGLEDYIRINLANGRPVLTLMTMKAVMESLPALQFMRIHRSYIIPLNKVVSLNNKKVMLASGEELPVSETYIGSLQQWIRGK